MNIVLIDNDVSFCDSLTKYLESSNNMKVLKTFDSNTKAFDFLETKDEKIDYKR